MSGPGGPARAPRTFATRPDGVLVWHRAGYELSTDRSRLDLGVIHGFLAESYWSAGATPERVRQSIEHSIPFGLYCPDGPQVGFARIVTDRTTFAWLADVFVLDAHRGQGLGRWLAACALEHPDVATVRNFVLATRDAHATYAAVGFEPLPEPGRFMRRRGIDYAPGRGFGELRG
jgi:GNAT superfamily N-acetyltransferase